MIKTNDEDKDMLEMEEANNNLLEILSELTNAVSMEEKYRDAGVGLKNNKTLSKLLESMNEFKEKTNE
jgi:hypothetical protein